MRAKLVLTALLSLLSAAACGGSDERAGEAASPLDDWYDQPERTLVRKLGAPDAVYDLTGGGRILTWRRSRTETEGGELYTIPETQIVDGEKLVVPVTRQEPIRTVRYECVMSFELDQEGYIVGFTAEGNDCVVPPPHE